MLLKAWGEEASWNGGGIGQEWWRTVQGVMGQGAQEHLRTRLQEDLQLEEGILKLVWIDTPEWLGKCCPQPKEKDDIVVKIGG